jgi:Protein of unknown function (DUF4230)
MDSELETTTVAPAAAQPRRHLPLSVLLIAGIALGILLTSVFAHLAVTTTTGLLSHLGTLITGRSTTLDTSAPAVIDRIRKLSRLETITYSIDKIVEGERSSPVIPSFLVGDKLLLIAHGEVIAGIDLGQLKPGDVFVHGDEVHIHLPAAQVLISRVDNQRTRVYSRTTGLLVPADPNLESIVRQAAEEQIVEAAKTDGILDKATQNARASIATLLYGLGFHTVDVS